MHRRIGGSALLRVTGTHEYAVVAVLHEPLLLRGRLLVAGRAHYAKVALNVHECALGHLAQTVDGVFAEGKNRVERRRGRSGRAVLVRRAGQVVRGEHVAKVFLAVTALAHLGRRDEAADERDARESRSWRGRERLSLEHTIHTRA